MSNYNVKLEKAQKLIVKMDFDKALKLLHQILKEDPINTDIFSRIYRLEKRQHNRKSGQYLLVHLLSHPALLNQCREQLKELLSDYFKKFDQWPKLNLEQIRLLITKLEWNQFPQAFEFYLEQIRSEYAEHKACAELLLLFSTKMVAAGHYIEGRGLLQYLLQFYAETKISSIAKQNLAIIEEKIN